jgi:hypothetical protein
VLNKRKEGNNNRAVDNSAELAPFNNETTDQQQDSFELHVAMNMFKQEEEAPKGRALTS